jgi:hypothetical protein
MFPATTDSLDSVLMRSGCAALTATPSDALIVVAEENRKMSSCVTVLDFESTQTLGNQRACFRPYGLRTQGGCDNNVKESWWPRLYQ